MGLAMQLILDRSLNCTAGDWLAKGCNLLHAVLECWACFVTVLAVSVALQPGLQSWGFAMQACSKAGLQRMLALCNARNEGAMNMMINPKEAAGWFVRPLVAIEFGRAPAMLTLVLKNDQSEARLFQGEPSQVTAKAVQLQNDLIEAVSAVLAKFKPDSLCP
jgi:hypothetical protein